MTTQQAPVPVNIGDVLLGKYVVERVIGAGGMGVVVAVRHRDLGELYAMKFMLPAALENEQAVERFVREARAAAKLKSEHVASVTDVGRLENGSPYMVMDHLVGQDLEGVLAQAPQNHLPVNVAAIYVMQACDAIAEAHDAGIVHRDLKPANLFLTARPNGSPCIKVLDFGISKTVDPNESNNSMTRTTAIMGSPYYMSPEQMRSSKNVDHRTDIWALGVILYQLSTGRVPFPGETITEVCSGVLADDVAPLHTVLAGIPPEFDGIVRRCLQKQPGMRFGSARELANALAPVAGVSPGTSGLNLQIAGAVPGVVQRMPSNPTIAMGPVGASVLSQSQNQPGALMAQSGSQPGAQNAITGGNQTQAQWGTTQPTQKKKSAVVPVLIGLVVVGGLAAGAVMMFNNSGKTAANTSKTSTAAPAQTTAEPAKSDAVAVATTATVAEPPKSAAPPPSASSAPVAEVSSAPSGSVSVAAAEPSSAKSSEKKTSGGIGSRPTPVKTAPTPIPTAANPPPTSTKPTIY